MQFFTVTRRYLSQEKSARKYTKPLSFDWAGLLNCLLNILYFVYVQKLLLLF